MATNKNQQTYSFTLFIEGVDLLTEENLDTLYDAGFDDALFGERDGIQFAQFDRLAPSGIEAIAAAISDIVTVFPKIQITKIEPDELVTAAEIAARSGLSREAIRLYSTGQRGPGCFPTAITYPDQKTKLWRWVEVATWLQENGRVVTDIDLEMAELIAALNAACEIRHYRETLPQRALGLVDFLMGSQSRKPRRRITKKTAKATSARIQRAKMA